MAIGNAAIVLTRITVGRKVLMNKFVNFLKSVWRELSTVIELFVYLGIAFAIQKLFRVTYLQAIAIVFIYFLVNLLRLTVENMRK